MAAMRYIPTLKQLTFPIAPKLQQTRSSYRHVPLRASSTLTESKMTGQEVHIIAILYPEPGKKAERMKELLKPMCKDVHAKEDYTLRYIMTEQIDSENPDIVMIETYKDKDAATKHTKEPHFKELFSTFEKEGLMRQPPYLAQTKSKAGFEMDRKFFS